MRFFLFACLLIATLSSCSRLFDDFDRINTTHVNINTGQSANGRLSPFTCVSPCLVGGMFVIAIDPNGKQFVASAQNETTGLSLTLASNTNYNFYAYGWDTPGMMGTPRCGYGAAAAGGAVGSVQVNGSSTDVYISMSQESCSDAMFAAAGLHFNSGTYGPVPLTLSFCGHGASVSSGGSFSSVPSSCSPNPSSYFTWGTANSSIGNGGYLSASNTVVMSVNGLSVPTMLAFNASSGSQSNPLAFTSSNRLSQLAVAPALSGSGTQRFAFLANLNNPEVDDLYLCSASSCTNAANYVTHLTHDAAACTGTANVGSGGPAISISGCTGSAGQLVIDPTGTIPPDTFLGTGAAVLVDRNGASVNATATNSSLPVTITTAQSVREFRFSPDGKYLVYVVVSPGSTPKYDLYSVDISGANPGAPLLLNGTLTGSAHGVGLCLGNTTGCNNTDQRFNFQVSPVPASYVHVSLPYVTYASDETTANLYDLHVATVDGSALYASGPANGMVTTNLGSAGDYTNGYTFTNDGAYVLVHTHVSSSDYYYSVAVTGSAAPVATIICGNTPSGFSTCNVNQPYFAVANSATAAHAYAAFQTYSGVSPDLPALNVIDLAASISTGTNPAPGVLKPATASTDETMFKEFQFTPDDTYLVATSLNTSSIATCVRSAPSAGGSTVTYNSCPGQLAPSKVSGGNYVRVVQDASSNDWVLFLSRRSGSDYDLVGGQVVPSSPTLTTLSQNSLTTGEGVVAYGFGSDKNAYYAVNPTGSGNHELYKSNLSTSPTRTRVGSTSIAGSISNISDDTQTGQGGGNSILNSGLIYMEGAPLLGGGATEAFILTESSGSIQRMTALNGLGRVQISVSGATSSPCLIPSAPNMGSTPVSGYLSGGTVTATNLKIPFGDGTSNSPFGVTVSVFANASDCGGSPSVQYNFPHGLASLLPSPGSAAALFTNTGPNNAMLYLTDQ